MDANIKTAASLLRKASYNLQYRAKELQSEENSVRRLLDREENKLKGDLWATGAKMSSANVNNGNSQYLVKHTYDLYQRKKQLETETAKKVASEEKEIHSLQSQARKLDELAHTLEMWSW